MTDISDNKKLATPRSSIEEAVLSYANGQSKNAIQLILTTIYEHANKSNKDNVVSQEIINNKHNWLLALDMLQATKNQQYFDSFADHYSNFFRITVPVYNNNFLSSHDNFEQIGRTSLNIDINISDINKSKIEDFEYSSIKNKTCVINFSRSSIDATNKETMKKLYLLRNAMKKIRENNVNGVIMGETDFNMKILKIIKDLQVKFLGNEDTIKNQEQVYWLFMMEMHQWLGEEEEFESLSLDYSKIFHITPPAYNPDQIMQRSESKTSHENIYFDKKSDTIVLSHDITQTDMNKVIDILRDQIEKVISENDNEEDILGANITIDLNNVIRMDYAAASNLAIFLSQEFEENIDLQTRKNKIIFKNAFEFIIRLFDMSGVSNYITYNERNRNIIY